MSGKKKRFFFFLSFSFTKVSPALFEHDQPSYQTEIQDREDSEWSLVTPSQTLVALIVAAPQNQPGDGEKVMLNLLVLFDLLSLVLLIELFASGLESSLAEGQECKC